MMLLAGIHRAVLCEKCWMFWGPTLGLFEAPSCVCYLLPWLFEAIPCLLFVEVVQGLTLSQPVQWAVMAFSFASVAGPQFTRASSKAPEG